MPVMARLDEKQRVIPLLILSVFLYWVSLYLYAPTLPTYVASKTDNLAMVGVVLSMYGLWQAVTRVPLGILSDWVGRRKPFILAGFLLAGLGAWMMGAAPNVTWILLGRAVTGLAASTWVPLVVLFSGLFTPREAVRASALLTMVSSFARMIATGLTGTLNQAGGYALAFYLAAGAGVAAFLILMPIHEDRRTPLAPSAKGFLVLLGRRDVMVPSLLSLIGQYANWGATFGFIPILAKQLGATDVLQSALVSLNIAVVTVGNLLASTITKKVPAQRLVLISFVLIGLGLVGATWAPSLGWIFAVQVCLGLAQGIGYPVLMGLSIREVDDAERATAMGLHQAIYAVGMFAGPALSGTLASALGLRPMFALTAAACLAFGLVGTRLLKADGA